MSTKQGQAHSSSNGRIGDEDGDEDDDEDEDGVLIEIGTPLARHQHGGAVDLAAGQAGERDVRVGERVGLE